MRLNVQRCTFTAYILEATTGLTNLRATAKFTIKLGKCHLSHSDSYIDEVKGKAKENVSTPYPQVKKVLYNKCSLINSLAGRSPDNVGSKNTSGGKRPHMHEYKNTNTIDMSGVKILHDRSTILKAVAMNINGH